MSDEMQNFGVKTSAFEGLPYEIIEYIASYEDFGVNDVYNLGLTSSRLSLLLNSEPVWRRFVKKRFLKVSAAILTEKEHIEAPRNFWKQIYWSCRDCDKRLREALQYFSDACFFLNNVPKDEVDKFVSNVSAFKYADQAVLDSLGPIINDNCPNENLTIKHYANETTDLIRRSLLSNKWTNFLESSNNLVSVYEGTLLLDQWFGETEELAAAPKLNELKAMVCDAVKEINPNHKILQENVAIQTLEFHECHVVFNAIRHVMFSRLGLHTLPTGKSGLLNSFYHIQNSFMKNLFAKKTGLPIMFCSIFISLCNSFGIHVHPVNFPQIFLVGWCAQPGSDAEIYKYIDVYNGIKLYSREECRNLVQPAATALPLDCFKKVPPLQVYCRILRNIRAACERRLHGGSAAKHLIKAYQLEVLINPGVQRERLELAELCTQMEVHLDEVASLIESIQPGNYATDFTINPMYMMLVLQAEQELQRQKQMKVKPKKRNEGDNIKVVYKVGMVMKHERYAYQCVIYGWDSYCAMPKQWQQRMGVHNLPDQQNQPFYNVLVCDGSHRYAAQENLTPFTQSDNPVTNSKVGKYFCRFLPPNRYEPNAKLRLCYPDD